MAEEPGTSEQPGRVESAGQTTSDPRNSIEWIDFRDVTVARGRRGDIPFLRLEGVWLRKAGFPVGSKVMVSVAEGRLFIEPISVRQALLFDTTLNAAGPKKKLTIDLTGKPTLVARSSVTVDRGTEDHGSDSKPLDMAAPERELTIHEPTEEPAQVARPSVTVDRGTEDRGSDSKPLDTAAPERELTIHEPTEGPAQVARAPVLVERATEGQGSDSKPQSWPHLPTTAVPSRR